MLVARAGLRVSPEGLCKTSIWVQLLLGGGGLLLLLFSPAPGHALLPTIGTVLHIFNLITVYKAQVRRTDYPWHVLKWTFPLGALAYCSAAAAQVARMGVGVDIASFVWFAIVYLLPACLQTALLWWRRIGNERVGGLEP